MGVDSSFYLAVKHVSEATRHKQTRTVPPPGSRSGSAFVQSSFYKGFLDDAIACIQSLGTLHVHCSGAVVDYEKSLADIELMFSRVPAFLSRPRQPRKDHSVRQSVYSSRSPIPPQNPIPVAMAPHAPFDDTLPKLGPHARLHLHSFEPSLAPRKDADGPIPASNTSPPYVGIGLVKPSATGGFDVSTNSSATSTTPTPQAGPSQTPDHLRPGFLAILVVPLLGIMILCSYYVRRRKQRPARPSKSSLRRDEPAAPRGMLESQLPRDRIRTMNAAHSPLICETPATDHAAKDKGSNQETPAVPQEVSNRRLPAGDYFSLSVSSEGMEGTPPSPTPSTRTSSEDSTPLTTPTVPGSQDVFYDIPLQKEDPPSPTADPVRFTWDFKCAGSLPVAASDPDAEACRKATKPPVLPPLTFSNPLGELMKLIRGPPTPPIPVSSDNTGPSEPSDSDSDTDTDDVSASSTWSAISISDSLEDLIARSGGGPLEDRAEAEEAVDAVDKPMSVPMPLPMPSQEPDPLITDGSESDFDSDFDAASTQKRSRLTLSKPNHRTLAPSTPALKQAAISPQSPSPVSDSERSSVSSLYSDSSTLAEGPMCLLAAGSGSGRSTSTRSRCWHRRTMSDASLQCRERDNVSFDDASLALKATSTSSTMRTSFSMPSCVEPAHRSAVLARSGLKTKFD